MRVAFVLRSAEVQPLFWDLCDDDQSLISLGERRLTVMAHFFTPKNPLTKINSPALLLTQAGYIIN